MSQVLAVPRWRSRAVTVGLALSITAIAVVGLASSASADFTTGKCAGPNIIGRGGSFATAAQQTFNSNFKFTYCVGTPGSGSINVTYEPSGSGAGIKSMEIRKDTPRFGGSDDPPTPAEVALMNSGGVEEAGKVVADTDATNDGKVHVFPVAVGSVVALVNFPDTCDPSKLPDVNRTVSKKEVEEEEAEITKLTGEGKTEAEAKTLAKKKKALLRVRFTKKQFEEIWAGDKDAHWSEVIPALTGCETPITRVVRFDQSGTSFAFKDYLNTINPAREWKTKYATTGANLTREWPNAKFGTRADCSGSPTGPGSEEDSIDHLTSACANGNGELVKKLAATDGSIGYADLATARNASPTLALDATKQTYPLAPYWIPVQNGSVAVNSAGETEGKGFTEPTTDPNGFRTDGQKGSNCGKATFSNVPAASFGDWSKTSGVNAAEGWGICTLTYALAFDDNSTVWGNSATEEQKARTVKDYEESIVSDAGQGALALADYARLPDSILAVSRADVSEIGWDKANSKHEEEKPVEKQPEAKQPEAKQPPSNEFSLLKKSVSAKKASAALSFKLPGAGKLDVLATAKVNGKKVTVQHSVLTATGAGSYTLTLKPKGATKSALQKAGKLAVKLTLTFTPDGGDAKTTNSNLTLKASTT